MYLFMHLYGVPLFHDKMQQNEKPDAKSFLYQCIAWTGLPLKKETKLLFFDRLTDAIFSTHSCTMSPHSFPFGSCAKQVAQ